MSTQLRWGVRALAVVLGVALACSAATAGAAVPRTCDQVLLPMHDGVRLHGWVNHEKVAAPRPVLLTISSYQNDHCPGGSSYAVAPNVASQMTMVFINMRGSGASEGTYDLLGADTKSDIHEVIAWAASQPWSDGSIVVAGASGNALFMIHALAEPAVIAAIAQTSCSDMYRCLHRGGATGLQVGAVYLANMLMGYQAGLPIRQQQGTYGAPEPVEQIVGLPAAEAQALLHPTYDDFWSLRSLLSKLGSLGKPVLYTTSNFDLLDVFDNWSETRNAWINLGISHSVWWDFALSKAPQRYRDVIFGQVNDFVSHFALHTGPEPPRVAQMIADGGFPAWHQGHAYLRTSSSWPLPHTQHTQLALAGEKSGSATSVNDGTLTETTPTGADTVPLISSPGVGQDLRTAMLGPVLTRGSGGPDLSDATAALWDLRREEAFGLTYTTPVLEQNLELGGPVLARIWATSTAADFTWVLRLTDVAPGGASEWITDGFLRAQMRITDDQRAQRDAQTGRVFRVWRDYTTPLAVPAEQPLEYAVQLADASNIFRAGHRIRLDVLPLAGAGYATGDAPTAGVLTLLHDRAHRSTLQLPVVPSSCADTTPLTEAVKPLTGCAAGYDDALTAARPASAPRTCASRRIFTIHMPARYRHRLRSATVRVDGRLVARLRPGRTRARIDLRGRQRVVVTVRIAMRLSGGRRVAAVRRYHPCVHVVRPR